MKSSSRPPKDESAWVAAEAAEDAAHRAWHAGDLRTAFDQFRVGARLGWHGCMLDLGYFHDEGLGTLRSKHQAMHWYCRSFASGDVAAATHIAILFQERGYPRGKFHWLRRGALRGDGDALVDLARCHLAGVGVSRSTSRAVALARKALRSDRITPAGIENTRRVLASVWQLATLLPRGKGSARQPAGRPATTARTNSAFASV